MARTDVEDVPPDEMARRMTDERDVTAVHVLADTADGAVRPLARTAA